MLSQVWSLRAQREEEAAAAAEDEAAQAAAATRIQARVRGRQGRDRSERRRQERQDAEVRGIGQRRERSAGLSVWRQHIKTGRGRAGGERSQQSI